MALSPQKLDNFVANLIRAADFINADRGYYSLSKRYLDFSPMSYAALRWIAGAQRPTPTRLAKHLGAAPATVTSLLDRLEKSELVTRAPSTRDRRRIELVLTSRGRRAADAIAADDRAHVTAMLTHLPNSRVDDFLRDFAVMLDSATDEPAVREAAPKTEPQKTKPRASRSLLGRKSKRAMSPNASMATERRKPTRKPR